MEQHSVTEQMPDALKPPSELKVEIEDVGGGAGTITVKALTVGQYRQAVSLMDEGDELGRLHLSTGIPIRKLETLTPASYEALALADLRVNAYFFSYAAREASLRAMRRGGIGALASWGSAPLPGLTPEAPTGSPGASWSSTPGSVPGPSA